MQTDVSKERITTIVRVEILALLILALKDEGDTFLRTIGLHVDYMALYLRRWEHS
jgi:hypothetical protein